MKTWIISDTHFGHDALVKKYQVRPANYQDLIVKSWRAMVSQEDLIIHLGDLIVGNEASWIPVLSELPGRKILVAGNHDKRTYSWYMKNGFDFCCSGFVLSKYGLEIYFSHVPIQEGKFDLNVHGHLHNGRHHTIATDSRHFLVALEELGYHPLTLKYIVEQWRLKKH